MTIPLPLAVAAVLITAAVMFLASNAVNVHVQASPGTTFRMM